MHNVYTNLLYMHVIAYQCLVLPHLALVFSVQQMAPGHWEKQQAVLILHPPQFPLLLAKISAKPQSR